MIRRVLRISAIVILFAVLILVRVFENELFYDPFITFYKNQYSLDTLLNLDYTSLIVNTFFRYSLNTIISLAILHVAFRKKEILRFSLMFYSFGFLVLIIAYIFTVLNLTKDLYQLFFYIRRFLIQPIFILLLLPAFYYQHINK
jgi:exosortase F-associated protein